MGSVRAGGGQGGVPCGEVLPARPRRGRHTRRVTPTVNRHTLSAARTVCSAPVPPSPEEVTRPASST